MWGICDVLRMTINDEQQVRNGQLGLLSYFVHVSAALTTAVLERVRIIKHSLWRTAGPINVKFYSCGLWFHHVASKVLSRVVWESAKNPTKLCNIMRLIAHCHMQTNTGMNGEWNPSMWHLASELAGLGLGQGAVRSPSLDHKAPHAFGWVQAADEHVEAAKHQRYTPMPLDDSLAKGWGGQASHFCIAQTSSRRTRISPQKLRGTSCVSFCELTILSSRTCLTPLRTPI